MNFGELPPDAIRHITSFLVNENVKTPIHLDHYNNLRLVNKEINSYVIKYKEYFTDILDAIFLEFKRSLSHVNDSILYYIPLMPAVCSNDRCRGCNKKLPYWYPAMNNNQDREILNIQEKMSKIPNVCLDGVQAGYCMKKRACVDLYYDSLEESSYYYSPVYDAYLTYDGKIPTLTNVNCISCKNRINYTLIDNINLEEQDNCGKCKAESEISYSTWRY
jgi:hypothetical protein